MAKFGQMARLHDLALAEIEKLDADGVKYTPHDVVMLNAIAFGIEHPASRLELARGRPISVGGTTLWPFTLYGSDWYERVGMTLKGAKLQLWGVAFALAHGWQEERLLDFPDNEATKRVAKWARSLTCRQQQLEEAVSDIISQDMQPEDIGDIDQQNTRMPSHGDLSAELSAMCGGTPDQWERLCTVPYALALIRTIRAQNDESGRSTAKDDRMRYDRAMGNYLKRIYRRHEKAVQSGK